MPFLSITLKGYTRTKLAGHSSITLDLTKADKVTLVLGTNGSGKSSLLRALSWWPLSKNHFSHDGFYSIEATLRDKHYRFGCDFGKHNGWFFHIDHGDNENRSGNITAQRSLITANTAITKEIQDFIHGVKPFSTMSVAERKWLFSQMAADAGDQAFRMYKKLQVASRDASGSVKYLADRVGKETGRVVREDEQKRLQDDIRTTHDAIDTCLLRKEKFSRTPEELCNTQEKIAERIQHTSQDILQLNQSHTDQGYSLEEGTETYLLSTIQTLKDTVLIEKERLSSLSSETIALQQQVEAIRDLSITEANNYVEVLRGITEDTERLQFELNGFTAINTDAQLAQLTDGVISELADILVRLPSDPQQLYSVNHLSDIHLRIGELHALNVNTQRELTTLQNHFSAHQRLAQTSATCPACNTVFHPGYDSDKADALSHNIERLTVDIKENEEAIEALRLKSDAVKEYLNTLQFFQTRALYLKDLSPLWESLSASKLIRTDPLEALNAIKRYKDSLLLYQEYETLTEKQSKLHAMVKHFQNDSAAVLSAIAEADESERKIVEKKQLLQTLTERVKYLLSSLSDIDKIKHLRSDLVGLLRELQETTQGLFVAHEQQKLNGEIRALRLRLSDLEQRYSQAETQRALLESLITQLQEQQIKQKALDTMVSVMSPTSGLIAEIMLGYIKGFIQEVNAFVEGVWTYDLIINEPGFGTDDEGQLDYRFPVTLSGGKPANDIHPAETNSATVEIADLAIRIVALKQLGLTDALYLDEFGNSFDYQHRMHAYDMLRSYLRFGNFTQVFIINHYSYILTAFENPNVVVLCDRNIDLPSGIRVNTHVTFE